MAKKIIPAAKAAAQTVVRKIAAAPAAVSSTAVRNTPIPKAAPAVPARREITAQQIAVRAYEISQSGTGGSPDDNWFRAERELRGL